MITLPSWVSITVNDLQALEITNQDVPDFLQAGDVAAIGPFKMTCTGNYGKPNNRVIPIFNVGFSDDTKAMVFSDGERFRSIPVPGRIKKTNDTLVIDSKTPELGVVTLSKLTLDDAQAVAGKKNAEAMTKPEQLVAYILGENWKKV
jgi:hypothetical protein